MYTKSFAALVAAACVLLVAEPSSAAPFTVAVSDVGLDGSNNLTSITTASGVITPGNLTGSTVDLSNITRVINGSGVAPASVAAAQPYSGDLSLLTGYQDVGPTDFQLITFNAPVNTVAGSGNIDFVFMHARTIPAGVSFQALDTLGADIPGALVSNSVPTDINKGNNPANWFYGPLPSLAVIGNFPQHIVFAHAVGFDYTGTIGGVRVVMGAPGGTLEVFEAQGVIGIPEPGSFVLIGLAGAFGFLIFKLRRNERAGEVS